MGTGIKKSGLARRGLTALAGLAVVAGGLVGISAPAQAAAGDGVATLPTISDSQWLVGTTKAVTVGWTNSVDTLTSVLVRSPWPWTAGWTTNATGFPSTGRVASGAQTITCTQNSVAIVFHISSATTTGAPDCKYDNSANWKGVWISGGGLSVSSTATISVDFPSGQITAPPVSQTDTWLVGGYYLNYTPSKQAEPAITSYSDATHPDAALITIDIDPNGGTCKTAKVTGYEGTWGVAPDRFNCTRGVDMLTGYNTSADGSGISIAPEGNIHFTGDNRVYAQWFDPRTQAIPAGPVRNVVATSKWSRVQVNWDAPLEQGSFPVTNYLVQASPGGSVCITRLTDKKLTQCSFNNLTPGKTYTFKAQALTQAGWGDMSVASNQASPYEVRATGFDRKKGGLFQLFKSEVKVKGTAKGYPAGTKLHTWYKVGNDAWAEGSSVTSDAAGNVTWSKKFERKYDGTNIQVQFSAEAPGSPWIKNAKYNGEGMDFSNIVTVGAAK